MKYLYVSTLVNIPLRTYIRYENDESYGDKYKREYIVSKIFDKYQISENKGIYEINQIKKIIDTILMTYKNSVEFIYLFGSYSKGKAKDDSDIDLLISTSLTGLSFVGLLEKLRTSLNKKVDLIRIDELNNNLDLLKEILKDGIKIYG